MGSDDKDMCTAFLTFIHLRNLFKVERGSTKKTLIPK